eukprot:m.169934 g.169934  ORF g.169934 m.169934 type:complete len:63 (-) comp16482_c1_seq2:464-652(-)
MYQSSDVICCDLPCVWMGILVSVHAHFFGSALYATASQYLTCRYIRALCTLLVCIQGVVYWR